jgi:type III restriction enzyme
MTANLPRQMAHQIYLHLVVEIKGYHGEDAKEKASTMRTYWVPGVNHLGTHGRWAFAEFTDLYEMQENFADEVKSRFDKLIEVVTTGGVA